jgi:D-alanyl-D-alanine carboxypeptidase/D-alanyl-D-alanine-endopeptidase (penicillin-binding protein 4)
MLTRAYGPVWFALINQGSNVEGFREQQDTLLQSLMQAWGAVESRPPDFAPMGLWTNNARTDILLRVKGEGG